MASTDKTARTYGCDGGGCRVQPCSIKPFRERLVAFLRDQPDISIDPGQYDDTDLGRFVTRGLRDGMRR